MKNKHSLLLVSEGHLHKNLEDFQGLGVGQRQGGGTGSLHDSGKAELSGSD
jgi:hypothetical protein